jgi:hypothetical protein
MIRPRHDWHTIAAAAHTPIRVVQLDLGGKLPLLTR